MSHSFKFIDLFSGIGGFRMGLEACGGECVFSCEKDKYAIETYKANFDCKNHTIHNDIAQLKGEDIPEYDILCAGFPCQSFSILGQGKLKSLNKKTGLEAEGRGTLFFELARIIKETQPKAFILENVKNLIHHDKGNTFKIIKDILENDLKYNIQYRIINSKHFVPQARERIFIIGFKDKNNFDFNSIILPNVEYKLSDIIENKDKDFSKYTISDKKWKHCQIRKERNLSLYHGVGFSYHIADLDKPARTLIAGYWRGADILIEQKNKNPRMLTINECSKIMGFNFNKEKDFKFNVSMTQTYKQLGNAVVPQVVEFIGKEIIKFI